MIDRLICEFDKGLRTVFSNARSGRQIPGDNLPDVEMSDADRRHVAALMRVNHVGEICAQALYQGQAIMSSQPLIKSALEQAANEETEHLAWTEHRIAELGGRKSLLNPVWYGGALAIGLLAGRFGDAWNLGFLAETERQVEAHLDGHLTRVPDADRKTLAIVEQMKADEIRHADTAINLGARELPHAVKIIMKAASKIMTTAAYRI
ncbi:MAG TPA: 2-polyprenyl-3-methyl-6-methoxy-1,4-benzoquinone monooxygenase [Rhodocyclaceae bacterium]|nr:2-polyprenyl-3-methyl-6-methoxy-1,4-benzoquinone monooxygenase [Rhodocyclaceae bacterium]HMV53914.1 2-polyprenyl-3-methyl-6-methoxy-1,4-benzoquinone monooxygenase [Rhodocyclaceae bacterium]HNA02995.1 2-polyprenyl-3-methyl-6-methoxy-1,4-benzoquinone monooxygenase [Rhodocyclaceae bacterium]HNB78061.1 2-polyprenyl-3-methyl-6-methoxy-1,4-benzoquinone monooxygenase [Rhodocyclaceae bacterium]HNC60512.1 2-polyprenyl-3-methyl-6-methoxy-1,4-benzoquinone monooxygenase [Rhodocyclaceae bacterium]